MLCVLLPWIKKEPCPRFAARRTLFDLVKMLDHKRSAQGKVRSATIRNFCPALDRSIMISHVEQRSSHRESRGWFLFFFDLCFGDILAPVHMHHSSHEIATQSIILWIELAGWKPKWLPLNFEYYDVMRMAPISLVE